MAASFPNSVKTFVPKENGDFLVPEDVNSVYDEVTAVETYLLTASPWGSFYDTTDQTAANTTTAYAMKFGSSDPNSYHVSVASDGAALTRITVVEAGVYNIQFSAQMSNTSTSDQDANIWFRLDGSDIAYSNSLVSIPAKHGGIDGHTIAAWNFMLRLTAGQYVQIMWQPESTAVSLDTIPAGTTPTTPVTPSTILTVNRVSV